MTLPAPLLFFGMAGPFSTAALAALLAAGAGVAAVIVPAGAQQVTAFELLGPRAGASHGSPAQLAQEAQIPLYAVRHLRAEVQAWLAGLRPAVACVACWRQRFPARLLAVPAQGFLNVHPSLLPAYRGPYPLFWALRDGLRESGVTVHWMDAELDRGDLALQAPLALPEGVGPAVLDRAAGELGGRLLVEALRRLADGALQRQPQPAEGSYQPAPTAVDFTLDPAWSARHAFSFMRGTSDWGQSYPVTVGEETHHLHQALGYDPAGRLPAPVVRTGDHLQIQFHPGVLIATPAGDDARR